MVEYRIVGGSDTVGEAFDVGCAAHTTAAEAYVGVEENCELFGGIVEIDRTHSSREDSREIILGVGRREESQRSAQVEAGDAVETESGRVLLFEAKVDDTAHTFGVILSRGVGDDFDILDGRGRDLFEERFEVGREEFVRFAIDKDLDIGRATEGDVAIVVDSNGRDCFEDIGSRAATRDDVLVDIDDALVEFIFDHRAFGGDDNLLHSSSGRFDGEGAEG